jgi:hypothetical protein
MQRALPALLTFGLVLAAMFVGVDLWVERISLGSLTRALWIAAGICAVFGLFLLWRGAQLRSFGTNIATSRIGSAAQGYVELYGRAARLSDAPGWSDQQWLWRRIVHTRQSDTLFFRPFPLRLYAPVFTEMTDRPFLIRDSSGEAVVLPEGAEVFCDDTRRSELDDARVTEETIREGDPLYVLGEFTTQRDDLDLHAEAERLAADRKLNPRKRARFDLNRDGQLSASELLALHRAARLTVLKRRPKACLTDKLNTISRPLDGQRFIISTIPPSQLVRHYGTYLAAGGALLVGGALLAAILWTAQLS